MKLYGSQTSPFARKVRIVAAEAGLSGIELIVSMPTPLGFDAWLPQKNPLGKIPALELADGTLLYDSRVICEYLDSLNEGRKLIPADQSRWRVLRLQALADGIVDAGIQMRYESLLRPDEVQWTAWLEAQASKVTRGLDQLEKEATDFGSEPDLGLISIACAVGWLRFRHSLDVLPAGPVDFAARWPHLSAWFEAFSERPSLQATMPVG